MTTDQELLAVYDAFRTFETRLLEIKFTVMTGHKALENLMTTALRNQRQIRRVKYMQMFDFDIQHVPGTANALADALSRVYEATPKEWISKEEILEDVEDIKPSRLARGYASTSKEHQRAPTSTDIVRHPPDHHPP